MKRFIVYGLAIAGLIPFMIGALYHLSPIILPQWSWLGSVTTYYGAIILSFLGGIQWGMSLSQANIKTKQWLIFSNIISLMAFASLLVPIYALTLVILCFGYLLALVVDLNILATIGPMSGYRSLRVWLTIAVCLLIGLSGL
ncbi:MAG: hypothetical protein CL816_04800 [Coxiellaceae bacterium]|nr:hypothetical protein [Coxiellaceae bacterium]|tara:strand:+ start:630 stop:1055 length:426 start_codon:yes stop_codon:yes gene_type:complete